MVNPKHKLKDRKDDLYETHPCAVEALLKHQALLDPVWEPCAGRGAISKVLKDAGYTVLSQDLVAYDNCLVDDILTGIDFLMEFRAPDGCKQIITNPPYKLASHFIRKAIDLQCISYWLLPAAFLQGNGRSDIIDQYLDHVWYGIERLPFMHRDGWEGPKNNSSMIPFAWFCFDYLPHHASRGFTVKRISWR